MNNIKWKIAELIEDFVYWLDAKADLGKVWGVRLNGLADRLFRLQYRLRRGLPGRF
jgi:hypothetical protein